VIRTTCRMVITPGDDFFTYFSFYGCPFIYRLIIYHYHNRCRSCCWLICSCFFSIFSLCCCSCCCCFVPCSFSNCSCCCFSFWAACCCFWGNCHACSNLTVSHWLCAVSFSFSFSVSRLLVLSLILLLLFQYHTLSPSIACLRCFFISYIFSYCCCSRICSYSCFYACAAAIYDAYVSFIRCFALSCPRRRYFWIRLGKSENLLMSCSSNLLCSASSNLSIAVCS